MANKMVELEHFLFEYNPDIVITTETWLRPEIQDGENIPPAYRMIRKMAIRGEGALLVVKEVDLPLPCPIIISRSSWE